MGQRAPNFNPMPFPTVGEGHGEGQEDHMSHQQDSQPVFRPKRVVVVSKSSLLDYELSRHKQRFSSIDDQEFIKHIMQQHGRNIEEYRRRHNQQAAYISAICEELSDRRPFLELEFSSHGIDYRVVSRQDYTSKLVKWCDLVISAGGDGTFLTAAKKVRGTTPVIGINTDPVGSEGFLCLTGKGRRPAGEVVRQFLSNDFKWSYRQRIRVTMLRPGNTCSSSPISIVNNNGAVGDGNRGRRNTIKESGDETTDDEEERLGRELEKQSSLPRRESLNSSEFKFDTDAEEEDGFEPRLALNEVFMGETHAAKVSYYELQVDSGPMMKQKSSGMCICTGTGSTSWHYNINRLTEQNLEEILGIFGQLGITMDQEMDNEVVEEVCRRFNEMSFSIRDPVFNATFPRTISHGFARRIQLRSRCSKADLVLDGSTSIPFNRGAEVMLEIHPEDALRTARLNH